MNSFETEPTRYTVDALARTPAAESAQPKPRAHTRPGSTPSATSRGARGNGADRRGTGAEAATGGAGGGLGRPGQRAIYGLANLARHYPCADIEAVLRNEFGFLDFHIQGSLDGLIAEMR